MKLSEIKSILPSMEQLQFVLPDGSKVPSHFHVTEVGQINKHFIDCGGTVRTENKANFQLWNAGDTDHRLQPEKLLRIIQLSEKVLGLEDLDVEVEYQSDTIGKYGLEFSDNQFHLTRMKTDCLASDSCGIPQEKRKLKLNELVNTETSSCCTPGGTCCN
jgi:hypothetical protein